MQSTFIVTTFLKSSLVFTVIAFLGACGSTTKVARAPEKVAVEDTPDKLIKSPSSLLEEARQLPNPQQQLLEILTLTADKDCSKALQIAELITEKVTDTANKNQLFMIKAKCHYQQSNIEAAKQAVNQISESQEYLVNKYRIVYDIARLEQNWWQAANALYLISERNRDSNNQIWDMLQQIPSKELKQHSTEITSLSDMLELLLIQRNFTVNYKNAHKQLENWISKNSGHHFATELPRTLSEVLNVKMKFNNIAVMLPLSGTRKSQGTAIKEGILSAHFSHPDPERKLTFWDTSLWTSDPPVELQDYDLIIGPLLKENVQLIEPLVPDYTKVLSLNRVDNPLFQRDWYYFSLAPEDEAAQLTQYLAKKGFKKPMLVVADGSVYSRMEKVFIEIWQEAVGTVPVTLKFTDNKELRKEVNEKFDLSSSKARVKQIRNLLRTELHSFERNRRDVDAIVVFANATQTELINPLIEASISPFADIIPVFATSRSHSKFLSANGLRDLRNLYIIDMPWMLKTPQYSWLQQSQTRLWPDRRDTHNRLFALGYDAFNLASSIEILATLPNQTWQGMTGTLRLDDQNQITRTSMLAQFNEEDVLPVARD